MLLRFSAANHLSFREQGELSLAASSLNDDATGLLDCSATPGAKFLPAAVIYGANASGKSNFIDAIRYMCVAVLHSHRGGEPKGGVARTPFALDPACAEVPSKFDADFVVDGTRYHYGFEASNDAFDAEWLYAYPNRRRQILFERNRQGFKFGGFLKGRNRVIADLTRPNSLFLSAAAQNDHRQLSTVAAFFRSVRIDAAISILGGEASVRLADTHVDDRVINFLDGIGTGVIGYRRQRRRAPKEILEIQLQLRAAIKLAIRNLPDVSFEEDEPKASIELAHRGHEGEAIYLDLDRESAGTRRLLVLLVKAFRALDAGALLLIDELDASLHTRASEAVLALFSSPAINRRGAQLIATTHDTNLLRSHLLRRDQVWFTEKDAEGATHLYPLTDIRSRKGDNIAKGYLQGRYGAIPFAGGIGDVIAPG